jgi:hypothetical protein
MKLSFFWSGGDGRHDLAAGENTERCNFGKMTVALRKSLWRLDIKLVFHILMEMSLLYA